MPAVALSRDKRVAHAEAMRLWHEVVGATRAWLGKHFTRYSDRHDDWLQDAQLALFTQCEAEAPKNPSSFTIEVVKRRAHGQAKTDARQSIAVLRHVRAAKRKSPRVSGYYAGEHQLVPVGKLEGDRDPVPSRYPSVVDLPVKGEVPTGIVDVDEELRLEVENLSRLMTGIEKGCVIQISALDRQRIRDAHTAAFGASPFEDPWLALAWRLVNALSWVHRQLEPATLNDFLRVHGQDREEQSMRYYFAERGHFDRAFDAEQFIPAWITAADREDLVAESRLGAGGRPSTVADSRTKTTVPVAVFDFLNKRRKKYGIPEWKTLADAGLVSARANSPRKKR